MRKRQIFTSARGSIVLLKNEVETYPDWIAKGETFQVSEKDRVRHTHTPLATSYTPSSSL